MSSRRRSLTSRPAPAAPGASADDEAGSPAGSGPSGCADRPDDLLRAGLTALDNVRNDVVRHHTDMIERLLGIQRPAAAPRLMPTLGLGGFDSFGLRKFEDVLDQRVAAALQRLGYPGADELQAMRDEIGHLRELVEHWQARAQSLERAADDGRADASPRAAKKRAPDEPTPATGAAKAVSGKAAGARPASPARTRIPARKRSASPE
ncbi:MAG: poly granule associated family protein [Burkholderiaceae bacterium]